MTREVNKIIDTERKSWEHAKDDKHMQARYKMQDLSNKERAAFCRRIAHDYPEGSRQRLAIMHQAESISAAKKERF